MLVKMQKWFLISQMFVSQTSAMYYCTEEMRFKRFFNIYQDFKNENIASKQNARATKQL